MAAWGEARLSVLSDAERFDWLRLIRCENIGPRTFFGLIERYGTAGAALEALPSLIKQGKTGRPIRIFGVEEAEQELEAMDRLGAIFLALCEPDYPALLRRIDSAPPLLAVRGNFISLRRSKVAIVGARNASAAGLAFTEQLARGLGRAGHVIVSGLARGIDSRAHQTALATGTIAVVASGLGAIYPAENLGLVEQLIGEGVVMSEMPFGWEPRGRDFPRRNRIVSGLSRGIIVVEAARGSGSLWTAKFAAEQGREIFAVPGSPLDPRAEGTNDLLRDGATFCTCAEDVITALAKDENAQGDAPFGVAESGAGLDLFEPLWDELDLADQASVAARLFADAPEHEAPSVALEPVSGVQDASERPPAGPAARTLAELTLEVTELLGPTPIPVDEIVRAAKAPAREVRVVLFELERAGRLERHGGDLVSLIG
jgi:DNA processing protein